MYSSIWFWFKKFCVNLVFYVTLTLRVTLYRAEILNKKNALAFIPYPFPVYEKKVASVHNKLLQND